MPIGAAQRAREALRSPDFRRLFAIRLVSQSSDGLFQASLVASVVFSPEQNDTALGFAIASLLVGLPFSILGPFAGVLIDRWSRRRILIVAPLLRAAIGWMVLFDPTSAAVPFYLGALWVLSVNRFYLSTAAAVVPRVVPTPDLLVANSMATVGGTFALLVGVFTGGKIADAFGSVPVVVGSAVMWCAASLIASRIATPLAPHRVPTAAVRDELARVVREFADGITRMARTPRAVGPITTIYVDQMGQGLMLVLSLVVFRDRFGEGIGSFSNLIGAGGLGVLLGILTVGALEERFAKERIISGAFVVGGLAILGVAMFVTPVTVLLGSFAIGLTFAWKKIPTDTIVQSSIPDGYRGRVFSVYDVGYNLSRAAAGFLAVPLLPTIGESGAAAIVGIAFLLWSPVLPRWIGRVPQIRLDLEDGTPVAVHWGGVREAATVRHGWTSHDGEDRVGYRLELADGTVIDVSRPGAGGDWRLDRELRG